MSLTSRGFNEISGTSGTIIFLMKLIYKNKYKKKKTGIFIQSRVFIDPLPYVCIIQVFT